jgi:hypothetical protein
MSIDVLQASLDQSNKVLQQLVPSVQVKGAKAKRQPFCKYVNDSLMQMSMANFNRVHNQIANILSNLDVEKMDEEEEDEEETSEAGSKVTTSARTTPVPTFHQAPPSSPVRLRSAPPAPSMSMDSSAMWQPPPQHWSSQAPDASVRLS